MPFVTFTDGRIYIGGHDLSGQTNDGSLLLEAREIEVSSIKDAWEVNTLGRKRGELNAKGFWNAGAGTAGDVETKLGTGGLPVSLFPDGSEGSVGYSMLGMPTKFTVGGGGGDVIPFSVVAKGNVQRAVRGTVLKDDTAAVTADGNGTGYQLGAVSSTQRVYCALHVLAVSGTNPTLDVTVVSDNASNFATPTTRLTMTQMTAIGADWQSAAGAITDDYWRLAFDIGGTDSPSFTVAALVAII